MGYSVYLRDGRWAGYGVPAVCDHPECEASIDRGLYYICGGEPGSDKGCGLFFCSSHMWIDTQQDNVPQMCERCCDGQPPFALKPDTGEWIDHMLTDESWAQWRTDNPEQVEAMRGSGPARRNVT